MLAKPTNLFLQWLVAMGFNGKQIAKGGELLGYTMPMSARRSSGDVEITLAERLAMSALRAGLPPWSPGTDAEIVSVKLIADYARSLVENPTPSKTTEE